MVKIQNDAGCAREATPFIVRVNNRRGNFTVLDNRVLQNADLSFKARGVHAYIMSLPDDWKPRLDHITTQGKEGKHALQSAFQELEAANLAQLVHVRRSDNTFAGTFWRVYEVPFDPAQTDAFAPDDALSRQLENPSVGKPRREKKNSDNKTLSLSACERLGHDDSEELESNAAPNGNAETTSTTGKGCLSEESGSVASSTDPPPTFAEASSTDPFVQAFERAARRRATVEEARAIRRYIDNRFVWDLTLREWASKGYRFDRILNLVDAFTGQMKTVDAAERRKARKDAPPKPTPSSARATGARKDLFCGKCSAKDGTVSKREHGAFLCDDCSRKDADRRQAYTDRRNPAAANPFAGAVGSLIDRVEDEIVYRVS